ncbi:MAG: hypothetical protein AB3N13_06935 [Arenibacterium sp.]
MFRTFFGICIPVLMSMLAAPLSFALGSVAQPDRSDLYLIVGSPRLLTGVLAVPEAREIGPYRAPFARIVYTSPDFHDSLVTHGYWVFPATPLAELCGIRLSI